MNFLRRPRRSHWIATVGIFLGSQIAIGAPVVHAAVVPVVSFPTLELQRTILTSPFVGAPTKRPGDIEGLAFDPVRNTVWLADDSKYQLFEIDYTTGALLQTITPAMLAATLKYQISSPPSAPAAGLSRAGDLEALAYDAAHDQLFAFAGPCCPPAKPHDPTVFRLTRGGSGHFELESYQPLSAEGPLNDFSGVGAINGQLWGGLDQTLYRYDYVTNTFPQQVGPLSIGGGKLNGVGFSADAKDLWVTASNHRLYRFAWPGLDRFPDHDFSMPDLGLLDTRAVEIVGSEIVLADGYDYYPAGTPNEFALRIYTVGVSAPTASFATTPTSAVGGTPFTVAFRDTSSDRPTTWLWDFGDGATSTLQHPTHVFTEVRTHAVKLTVTNPNGSSSTTSSVTVTRAPTAAFTMSTAKGTAPLTVTFTNASVGGTSPIVTRTWEFGDGATSTAEHPSHVFATAGTFRVTLTVSNDNGAATSTKTVTVTASTATPPPSTGRYIGVNPARLLDTRQAPTIDGRFSGVGPLGPGQVIDLPVVGRGNVPMSGVGAVVLNVTVTGPTHDSYMTVWPRGEPRPTASNLNYRAGATVPNLVMVPVGRDGQVSLFNESGATHVVVDVLGYAPVPGDGAAGVFRGLSPARLMDTRGADTIDGLARTPGALGAGATTHLAVAGRGGVPVAGAGSVALNVTVVGPTAGSYVTVWPAGDGRPTASNINFQAGQTVPNMVIVPLGADGQISLFNAAGSTQVLVDVLGWFPQGTGFDGMSPRRLMDTRGGPTFDGVGQAGGGVAAGTVRTVAVHGRAGLPTTGAGSVVLNVTAVDPTSSSYLTVWPTGFARPTASNLNVLPGETVANLVVVPIGVDGTVSIYNDAGTTQLVVDILGVFAA